MKSDYHYISSPQYIDQLEFDYIKTYSLQRGKEFEENYKLTRQEYTLLDERKRKSNNLSPAEEGRYSELQASLGTQYLINSAGLFHPSGQQISTFSYNTPQVKQLINILKTKVVEVPAWMCAPVYRDAIVFYNNDGAIVSVLNVCLGCCYMETKAYHHINADSHAYELMREFFIDIGHPVESKNHILPY
jgi:hypothetical protein